MKFGEVKVNLKNSKTSFQSQQARVAKKCCTMEDLLIECTNFTMSTRCATNMIIAMQK